MFGLHMGLAFYGNNKIKDGACMLIVIRLEASTVKSKYGFDSVKISKKNSAYNFSDHHKCRCHDCRIDHLCYDLPSTTKTCEKRPTHNSTNSGNI